MREEIPKLSPKLQHELAVLRRAARHPKLKTALAVYDRLRARGIGHKQAVHEAAEIAGLEAGPQLN
jgi:hypothetical protein